MTAPVSGLHVPYMKAIELALLFAVPDLLFLTTRYLIKQGRFPNLIHPSAFSEKVLCKILFDRNKLLPFIADKLSVRNFVRERVGLELLTTIYGVYGRETEICLGDLPDKFVLKANHGSDFNYFVESSADKNPEKIARLAHKWLTTNYGLRNRQWAHKSINRKVFAEEYLEPEGNDLFNYKFFCFDGEPRYLKVPFGPPADRRSRFFDLDWNALEVIEGQPNYPPNTVPRPGYLMEMIEIARLLSRGFDFLRVDLYNIRDRIVFSELTNYPAAANHRFLPPEYDYKFGSYWNLESMTYLPIKWMISASDDLAERA